MKSDTIELLTHLSTLFTKKEITKDSDFHMFQESESSRLKEKNPKNYDQAKAFLEKLTKDFHSSIIPREEIERPVTPEREPVRLYVDGCFDQTHSGHFNALRRAKQLCDVLVVGVVSDEEIKKYKGIPLMTMHERAVIAKSCKWVDEVVIDVPYFPTLQVLDMFKCQFLAHGDDLITVDGQIMYAEIREAGRFKIFKRTEGISSTDIVGRMLTASYTKRLKHENEKEKKQPQSPRGITSTRDIMTQFDAHKNATADSDKVKFKMLNSTRRILQFSNNRNPTDEDTVVYVSGSFDMMHPGHCKFLEKAKDAGTYQIVGIYDDDTVNLARGDGHPILSLNERVLSVLAMRYVDEVIIGAPWELTKEICSSLGCKLVAQDHHNVDAGWGVMSDPNSYAKQAGIYQIIDTGDKFNSNTQIDRMILNNEEYSAIYNSKTKKQQDYYQAKLDGKIPEGDQGKDQD